jgi:hypothetical protein
MFRLQVCRPAQRGLVRGHGFHQLACGTRRPLPRLALAAVARQRDPLRQRRPGALMSVLSSWAQHRSWVLMKRRLLSCFQNALHRAFRQAGDQPQTQANGRPGLGGCRKSADGEAWGALLCAVSVRSPTRCCVTSTALTCTLSAYCDLPSGRRIGSIKTGVSTPARNFRFHGAVSKLDISAPTKRRDHIIFRMLRPSENRRSVFCVNTTVNRENARYTETADFSVHRAW